jgi:peptide/nickel transport system ATP-binding protein
LSDAPSTDERASSPLLELRNVSKHFAVSTGRGLIKKKQAVRAVERVSLSVFPGEIVGVVGESGSGKTTLLKTIAMSLRPEEGEMLLDGTPFFVDGRRLRRPAGRIQVVFQDPDSSLNPTMKIRDIVAESLYTLGLADDEVSERVTSSLERVGLGPEYQDKYPSQLSGGQKQRVSIARALAPRPSLVLLDEPTSALDVAVQSQVINLLIDLQDEFNLTYLFVTHNISLARYLCDRIAVFYAGRIVEMGTTESVLGSSLHPYTRMLMEAFPLLDPKRKNLLDIEIVGEPPSPANVPSGCPFHPRCPYAEEICRTKEPPLEEVLPDHLSACHFAGRFVSERITVHKESE